MEIGDTRANEAFFVGISDCAKSPFKQRDPETVGAFDLAGQLSRVARPIADRKVQKRPKRRLVHPDSDGTLKQSESVQASFCAKRLEWEAVAPAPFFQKRFL